VNFQDWNRAGHDWSVFVTFVSSVTCSFIMELVCSLISGHFLDLPCTSFDSGNQTVAMEAFRRESAFRICHLV
jgi:hypothetical protein